jgi:hypothetical protein
MPKASASSNTEIEEIDVASLYSQTKSAKAQHIKLTEKMAKQTIIRD